MLLGELLVANGLATPDEIRLALLRQQKQGGRIGENLIALGVISRDTLNAALNEQYARVREILAREDLLARARRRFGDDHPQTHRQRCQLAQSLIAAGRPAQALELAKVALAGHEKALGDEHYWTIDSAQAVSDALAVLHPKTKSAVSPSEGPAVAARVGAGEEHAVRVSADDFDAARSVKIADRVDRVTPAGELTPGVVGEAALHGEHVRPVMRVVGVLTRHHRGPARHLGRLLRV
jgi:hypothetical protein